MNTSKYRSVADAAGRRGGLPRLRWAMAGAMALVLTAGSSEAAGVFCAPSAIHCTDGHFNLHSNGDPTTDANEWGGRATVSKTEFTRVGDTGGAWLYAEQGAPGDNTLYLMYDYYDPFLANPGFFDVFFQVGDDDYLVRIRDTGIEFIREKPADRPSNILGDGSFDTGTPWVPISDEDLIGGRFLGALGIGTSPNNPHPHPVAEFQVSVNTNGGGTSNGLYDPAPAFWSASAGGTGGSGGMTSVVADPPISSGIFTLYPDGTTTVVPALGPDGAPLQQGNFIPEPGSVWLIGLGLLGLIRKGNRNQHMRPGRE